MARAEFCVVRPGCSRRRMLPSRPSLAVLCDDDEASLDAAGTPTQREHMCAVTNNSDTIMAPLCTTCPRDGVHLCPDSTLRRSPGKLMGANSPWAFAGVSSLNHST